METDESPFDFSNEGGSGDAPPAGSPATSGTEAKDSDATQAAPEKSGVTAPDEVGEQAEDDGPEPTEDELKAAPKGLRAVVERKSRQVERLKAENETLRAAQGKPSAELAPVLEAAESLGGIPVLQETAAIATTFLDAALPPDVMAGQVLAGFQKLDREKAATFRDQIAFTTAEAFPDAFAQFLYGEGITDAKVKEALKALEADPDADWAETPKPDEKKPPEKGKPPELSPEIQAKLDRLDKLEGKLTAEGIQQFGKQYEAEIYSPVDAGLKALALEPKPDDTPEIAAQKAEDAEEIRALTERAFFKNDKADKLAKRAAKLIAEGDTEAADKLKSQLQRYADEAFRVVARRYSERVTRQAQEQRRELESKRRPELTPQGISAQTGRRKLSGWDEVTADDVAAFGA